MENFLNLFSVTCYCISCCAVTAAWEATRSLMGCSKRLAAECLVAEV